MATTVASESISAKLRKDEKDRFSAICDEIGTASEAQAGSLTAADFETLEHIAREMEFITLDELAEPSGGDYSYLGVGVG